VPLRPLGVGDILAGAWGYIRANPLVTLGVTAVVMVVAQAVQLIVDLTLPQIDPAELARGRISGLVGSVLGTLGSSVVAIVLGAVLTGLLLVVLSRAVLGQRIGVQESWQAVARRVPGLVGLTLLITLAIGATAGVLFVIAFVAAATGSGAAIVLAALLVMVAVAAALYLSVLWVFAPAAYVLEPVGVTAALGRSRQLVRGSWWRTLGILLLTGLLVIVPAIIVMGLFGALSVEPPDAAMMVRTAIASVVVTTFATPFGVAVTGLLYLDQRIRKERLDLELVRSADQPEAPR
jgi:hypothetical protein